MNVTKRARRDHALPGRPEIYLHRMRVNNAKYENGDIIDLGYADIRREPPNEVINEFYNRIKTDRTIHHYGDAPGYVSLRQAIAEYLSDDITKISPDNVIITSGANNGIVLALMATTVPGDSVLIPAPYFFNHVTQVQLVGCTVREVATHPENNYGLPKAAWGRVLVNRDLGAVLLTQPRNPTSTEMSDQDINEIASRALERNRPVIIDESYREFCSDFRQYPWSPDSGIIRVGSLSKSFCLAGWRIGYMIVPNQWRDEVIRAQDALMIHAPIASQHLALLALNASKNNNYVEQMAKEIAERRMFVKKELLQCAWIDHIFADSGTIVWVCLSMQRGGERTAERILSECGVGVLSGHVFGPGGESCLRIGVGCVEIHPLKMAIDRITRWGG